MISRYEKKKVIKHTLVHYFLSVYLPLQSVPPQETPINGLQGGPSRMGVQVHTVKMVVISLVKCKVYKRVGKSYYPISVGKKTQKG